MSDKFTGGLKAGSTSVSIPVLLTKTADGTEQTATIASGVTASYWRQGGTRTAITVSDLAAVNSAYTSGGWKEVDATNQPGLYRLDLPDAAVASGADWVVVSVKVTSCYVYHERIVLETDLLKRTVSTTPTAGTVEEALQGARAEAKGKRVVDKTTDTETLYDTDGTTTVKQFALTPIGGGPWSTRT